MVQGKPGTSGTKIMNSKILQNKKVGIHITGAKYTPVIEACTIE